MDEQVAHQQNVLLALKAGLPAGIALKDCQGVGLTDIAMQRFSEVFENEAPSYFMPTEQVNPYLAYYIFGNALTSTLANIAADCQLCENTLWAVCREKLQLWQGENPLDDSFYRFLLDSPYLKWKRNFYCFLSDLNESTLNDIDSIYCKIANPLQRQNSEASVAKTLPDGRTLLVQDMPPPTHTTVHLPPTKLTFELHYLGTSLATFECELAQLNAANEKIGQPDEHTYRQVGPKRAYLTQTRTLAALDTAAWWTAIEHTMFRLGVDEVCLSQLPEPVEHQILQDLNAFHAIAGFDTCSNTLLISRENVLMACPTWKQYAPLPVAQSSQQPKRVRAKNGIVHPVRPAKPNGVLFQRYLYSLGRTVRFRTLDIDRDLATFHAWHNHPQTADIWELAGSKSMHKDEST